MNLKSIALALALCACHVAAFAAADNSSGNPVFPGWYADPEAVKFGDEYWIYPTTSIPFDQQTSFDAFSSKNLKDWKRHPRILTTDSVSWARRAMWAPAVLAANGKYYMFFSANDVHEGEVGGIGVAVSDNPAGPFTDAIGHPLIGEIVNGAQPIDQFVFRDVDGQYYMYYGGWSHCNMVKLSPDLLSLEPFDDGQFYKEVTPKNYVEGPFMFMRDGKYIFMWSEGNWTKDTYRVAYAIADSPFGPFHRQGVILESDPDVATGAGHHSILKGNGNDEYYIVYHRHPLGATDGNNRVTCIDRMYFDKSGRIKPIKMTFDGIEAVSASDPVMDAFISDLMSRMTLEEKLGQLNLLTSGQVMTGPTFNADVEKKIASGQCGALLNFRGVDNIRPLQQAAVTKSRLGIPMIFGFDMIHGYNTIFPIPLALSCTWDMDIIEETARLTAKEATADGIDWDFSPMVDICRDPRWGRVAESGGEDPYLGSRIAEAYIRGYQGKNLADKEHLLACVKHFACYGAAEAGRDYNTVDMSRQMMYNYYLPPYRAAAEAGAGSFMSSFNLVDFVPATANKWLITDVLRKQWGFKGFVVTDYASIAEMVTHGMGNISQCAVRALKAGTDMDMVSESFINELSQALDKGDIDIADIDAAVRRILEAKYKLGLFKDPYLRLDSNRAATDIHTSEALAVSRRAAAESFVLLKNAGNILPLKKRGLKIAVVGPCADTRQNLRGAWAGTGDMSKCPTLLEEIRRVAGSENVIYAQGAHFSDNPRTSGPIAAIEEKLRGSQSADELLSEALDAVRNADVIVAAVGEVYDFSGEGASMADIELQASQQKLLKALKTTGKPIVMLNFAGRPNVLSWEDENLDAILNVWFGGSGMAPAIADVLFGDVSPSGKTTMTFPRTVGQIPIYYNHMYTGRPQPADRDEYIKYKSNYIDISNTPLYPFGFGLSYTTFGYSDLTISAEKMTDNNHVTVSVDVTNTGNRDADEIVQLYIRDVARSSAPPVMELKSFRRISLKAGERRRVTFDITPEMLKFYNYNLDYVAEPGLFDVMVGGCSDKTIKLSFEYQPENNRNTIMKLHKLGLFIPAIAVAISAQSAPKAPLMGWSSWNAFFVDISDSLIMRQTDLLGELGLADAGYRQVNIDDGFFGHRDSTGRMQPHPVRFPNGMRPVVDYIHSKGYKAGTYSDAGHNTCGSMWNNDTIGINAGMYEHEDIDAANAFGDWNFDFIKIDYCGAECDGLVEQEQYTKIRQALDRVRPGIALNICRWRFPGTWAEDIAESWRISQDIMNDWESIKSIVDLNAPLSAYCRDGHYNDMDMLTVGLRENTSLTGDGLDNTEELAHFGMWCIMSSPLLIGCDLEKIPASSLEILKNPELIAVNQDSLALQAYPAVRYADGSGIFVKDIVRRNGLKRAVALYNPTDSAKSMVLRFRDIDLGGKVKVRDLSNRRNLGIFKEKFTAEIPAHGAIVYAVEAGRRLEPSVYEAEWGYLPMFDNIGRNNVKYTYDTSSSGCMKVEFLGASPQNYIEWSNVYSEKGGHYSLNIKATPECPLQVRVNGRLYEAHSAADNMQISLKPGYNTIRIGHETSAIPAIDFISLVKQ